MKAVELLAQAGAAAFLTAWAMSLMLMLLDAEKQELRRRIAYGSVGILFVAFVILLL